MPPGRPAPPQSRQNRETDPLAPECQFSITVSSQKCLFCPERPESHETIGEPRGTTLVMVPRLVDGLHSRNSEGCKYVGNNGATRHRSWTHRAFEFRLRGCHRQRRIPRRYFKDHLNRFLLCACLPETASELSQHS